MSLKGSFAMISLLTLAACASAHDDGAVEEGSSASDMITTPTAEGATFTTTANLNLREEASRTSTAKLTIPKGETVTALEAEPQNGFYHVSFGEEEGWAFGQYLEASGDTAAPPAEKPAADDGADGAFDGKTYSGVTLLWQGNWDFLIQCDSFSRKAGNVTFYCGAAESRSFVDDGAWLAMPSGAMSRKMCNTKARVCKGDKCIVAKIVERSVTASRWEGSTSVLSALGVDTGFKSCTNSHGTATGVTITLE